MPASPPRASVEIDVNNSVVTLTQIEELCAAARDAGLRDDAEFHTRSVAVGAVTSPRPVTYTFRAPPDVPLPADLRAAWAVPGGPNMTTSLIVDSISRGLADPTVDRIMLDRAAATTLLHGKGGRS